jgi:hypothetical protein
VDFKIDKKEEPDFISSPSVYLFFYAIFTHRGI